MLFKRLRAYIGGVAQVSRSGFGLYADLRRTDVATNTDQTITVDQMAGGHINFTSFSAGRAVTTPTAALILAQCPDMDIGDTFSFLVSCQAAFAATWVAGANVTLAGRATTPASSYSVVTVRKLTATTVEWFVS